MKGMRQIIFLTFIAFLPLIHKGFSLLGQLMMALEVPLTTNHARPVSKDRNNTFGLTWGL